MKITQLLKTAVLTGLFCSTTPIINAQKFGTPIRGLGNMNIAIDPIGFIDDSEIFSLTTVNTLGGLNFRLYAYKDKKKVAQQEMVVNFNGKKYVPDNLFIKDKRIYAYFLAEDATGTTTALYFQEFNKSFEQIGNPTYIVDLPYAIDGNKFRAKYGGYSDKGTSYQSLTLKQNEITGEILVIFSVQYQGKNGETSYAKIINVDDRLQPIASRTFKTTNPMDIAKFRIIGMFPNNDVLVYANIGRENKGSSQFTITSNSLLFIPGDSGEIEDIEVGNLTGYLKGIVASEDLNSLGNYQYAFHTSNSNNSLGTITLYEFSPKTKNLTEKSYSIDSSIKFNMDVDKSEYRLKNMYSIDQGDVILDLNGKNEGSVAIRLGRDGNVLWGSVVRPQILCNGFVNDAFSTLVDDEMKVIFNIHPAAMTPTSLQTKKPLVVDLKSKPTIATINLEDGRIEYAFLTSPTGTIDGAICFTLSKKLAPGKFMLRMKYNGMVQNVPVTF